MATVLKIPVKTGAVNSHQIFSVQLGENFITFHINYAWYADTWVMDLYDKGSLIGAGITINAGANLTGLLELGEDWGNLYCLGDDVTLDNLGVNNAIVWRT